ncbi:MAG TPA: YceI family protein [Kofleriaceae bacterium]|nr:YceI family protein [Kofleriaceae bacterium]
MKSLKLIVLATVLAAAPACKKKKEEAPVTPTTEPGSASGAAVVTPDAADTGSAAPAAGSDAGSAAGSAAAGSGSAAAATDPNADSFAIVARHEPAKPNDPVVIRFEKFTVKKASFDATKIEGGTATIEVDLASIKSDSPKRDQHLTTADYIDTSKYTTLTIDISNVKKKADKTYTADAKVKLREVEKTYPVTFDVIEAKDDWIKVKGEHKFSRLDFKVGKEKIGPDEGVAPELTAQLQMTLKKT